MTEKHLSKFGFAEAGPYSLAQAVRVGDLVFVSGQISLDDNLNLVGADDMQHQMRVCYQHIVRALTDVGATIDDVVDETLFVADMQTAAEAAFIVRPEVYGAEVEAASTLIAVPQLGFPGALVEIKCCAVVR